MPAGYSGPAREAGNFRLSMPGIWGAVNARTRTLGSSLNTTRKLKKSRPAAPMIRTFRGSALGGSAMEVRKPQGLKAFPVGRYRLNDVSAPGGAAQARAAGGLSSGARRRPVGVAEARIRRCGTQANSQHPDCCLPGVLSGISPRNSYYIAVLMDVHDRWRSMDPVVRRRRARPGDIRARVPAHLRPQEHDHPRGEPPPL